MSLKSKFLRGFIATTTVFTIGCSSDRYPYRRDILEKDELSRSSNSYNMLERTFDITYEPSRK